MPGNKTARLQYLSKNIYLNLHINELVSPKIYLKKTYVIGDSDSGFPYLISPVDIYNATKNFLHYKILFMKRVKILSQYLLTNVLSQILPLPAG